MRQKLIANKIQVSDLVALSSEFQDYANILLKSEREGKLNAVCMKYLHDYLMLCLDVYTYSSNGDVLIPDYTYDMVMNIYCRVTKAERLVYADYIMSTMLWPFVKHEAPFMVGTINRKIYDVNTLDFFLKQLKRDGYHRLLYAPKFDGISAAVTIRNGLIERAVTRNNGVEGQDITEVIRRANQHKKIFTKKTPDGYYKCELVVTSGDFQELVNLKEYRNRRSAASAIVSAPSNLIYAEFLTAIPLAWVNFEGTQMKYLAYHYADGYVEKPESFETADVYDNIEHIIHHIRQPEYPIRTDGVVIFPIHTFEDEPNTTDLMANCLAYKINTQEATSRVVECFMSVGRTGLAKPMVKVVPVEVNEVFMKQATPGSMATFAALNLHKDEEVIVFAAGDVIPQIRLPEPRSYPKGAPRLIMDIHCPYCGKKLRYKTESEAHLYCMNPRCPKVLSGRIVNFLDKLDIAEGFRDATFYNLVQRGVVTGIPDLFTLTGQVEAVSKTLGSRLEAEKLLKGLHSLKTKTFEVSQVIGSLGIEGISIKTCQKIFRDYSLDYLLDLKKNRIALELMNVEGIGSSVANQMSDWINENRDFIEFLLKHMKIIDDRITYGNVVFTGFRNKEYADKFKDIGFPQHEKTTNDTVAVVYAGDVTSSNAKAALAKDIPLIHVAQLDDLYEELKKRDEELKNQEIKYGRYQLIRDIRAHVQCYRAV